jgi:hypothetical protein
LSSTTSYGPSKFAYSPTWYNEFTATGAYPQWVAVTGPGTLNTQLGIATYTLGCLSPQQQTGSNSNAYIWSEAAILFNAPASGTSATTNVKAVSLSPTGGVLSTTQISQSGTAINFNLNLFTPNTVAMLSTPIYPTASAELTNYNIVPNAQVTGGNYVTTGGIFFLITNQTGITVSSNSIPLQAITSTTIATGERAWIGSVPSCGPAGASASSSSPFTCASVQLTITANQAATTHHIDLYACYTDEQQLGFVLSNLGSPAVTSFPAAGSIAGLSTGFSGLTPTSGVNAANPSPLVTQCNAVIMPY